MDPYAHMEYEVFKPLKGARVLAVKYTEDLYIQTDRGIYRMDAEGD